MNRFAGSIAAAALALALSACGQSAVDEKAAAAPDKPEASSNEGDEGSAQKDLVVLTAQQISDAGIEVARPTVGGVSGAVTAPALIQGDPQGVQVVAASIGGRVVSLTRNLGQSVRQGDTLAVIQSREAASLKAEVEAAQARAALARSNLDREQRLFAERVSPKQDLIAARTAAIEANIALRLAQQQLGATGGGGGALNRIAVRAPISGQIIARPALLGQAVDANAELFRVANLSRVTVAASLSPPDASKIGVGSRVEVSAAGRRQEGRVTFVSPVLDENTRLIQIIASLDNTGGTWKVGEPVQVSFLVSAGSGGGIAVPTTAIQTVDNKQVVFVRTKEGFRAIPVRTGSLNGSQVIILSGLTGNEQIATTNSFTLKAELGKGGEMDMD